MKYELWSKEKGPVGTAHKYLLTTDIASQLLPELLGNEKKYIRVIFEGRSPLFLNSYKELKEFVDDFYDRKYSQNVEKGSQENMAKDAINPTHYKNVAAGKQYMELMVDMLAGKTGVEAHLFGQVYKYLMRCGGKDEEVQELKKALWYLEALIKYKTEGKVL